MRGSDFDEIVAFAAIAETGSFAKGAERLGLAVSTVSHRIRRLEARLEIRLLNRTTRSVALTEAGERYLSALRPAFGSLDEAAATVGALRSSVAGKLRLTVPPPAADTLIAPILTSFVAAYPDVRLEVSVSGARTDIVKGNFDAGIRLGELVERDMIAVRLGPPVRALVVAAPSYLTRRGVPDSPYALDKHDCIRVRLPGGRLLPWRFQKDGEVFQVETDATLVTDDRDLELRAALDGVGIACVLSARVVAHVAEGQLVALLEAWALPDSYFHLYYPGQRHVTPCLRAFIDFARAHYRSGTVAAPQR